MNPRFLISLLFAILFALAGCDERPRHHAARRPHHQTKDLTVHHLVDGRYVYRDDNGMFWFYMYMLNSGSSSSSSVYQSDNRSYNYVSSAASASVPRGGAWVSTTQLKETPQAQEQLELELADPKTQTAVEPVEVDSAGGLIEPTELATETQMELDLGNEPGVTGESADSGASSSDSSSSSSDSSSSGSSDSGSSSSGGDSGGGSSSE